MANQSFTTLSSFGIFPVIGTFGDGYFQKGNRGVNPFNTHLPHYFSNLHMMEAPKLGTIDKWRREVADAAHPKEGPDVDEAGLAGRAASPLLCRSVLRPSFAAR